MPKNPEERHQADPHSGEEPDATLPPEILDALRAAEAGDKDAPLLDNERVTEADVPETPLPSPPTQTGASSSTPPDSAQDTTNASENSLRNALMGIIDILEYEHDEEAAAALLQNPEGTAASDNTETPPVSVPSNEPEIAPGNQNREEQGEEDTANDEETGQQAPDTAEEELNLLSPEDLDELGALQSFSDTDTAADTNPMPDEPSEPPAETGEPALPEEPAAEREASLEPDAPDSVMVADTGINAPEEGDAQENSGEDDAGEGVQNGIDTSRTKADDEPPQENAEHSQTEEAQPSAEQAPSEASENAVRGGAGQRRAAGEFEPQEPEPADTTGEAPPAPEETAQAPREAETAKEPLDQDDLEALIAAVDRDTTDSAAETDMPAENEKVDQNMVDALLQEISGATADAAGNDTEAPLDGDMDEPVVPAKTQTDEAQPAGEKPDEGGPANQALIDALLAGADSEGGNVGSENLAAAATSKPPDSEAGLLSQEDLDAMVAQAQAQQEHPEKQRAAQTPDTAHGPPEMTEDEVAATKEKPGRDYKKLLKALAVRREPGPVGRFMRRNAPRIAASLAAGLLAALGAFTGLYQHNERTPSMTMLKEATETPTLETAIRRARELMAAEEYTHAAALLERPIAEAPLSPLRADAQYLRAEALYRALPSPPDDNEARRVLAELQRVTENAPAHPRAPFALHWQGRLFEALRMNSDAQAAYARVIQNYGGAPNLEQVLLDAARLALDRHHPENALVYARQILQQFPDSTHHRRAELLIGDAYAQSGMVSEARALYVAMAENSAEPATSAKAFQRLGEMALEQGRFEDAIEMLERRLENATTTAGNDRVYLKLAQAYRQAGRLEDARDTLNDLINFFPESQVTPEAYIALSRTLADMGQQPEAIRVAQQALSRYDENPAILEYAGKLYANTGRHNEAADLLVAADKAGAQDPALLLAAGKHYRRGGQPIEALRTFERIGREYPRAGQAVTGNIEAANVLYGLGQSNEAVQRLENITATSNKADRRLPALTSLAKIYRDMGLRERLKETAQELTTLSDEPEVLAEAATALFDAEAYSEGLALAERVDLSRLPDRTAYELLMAQGQALTRFDPRRALDKMEDAYMSYPEARSPAGDRKLLAAYLATNRRAAARRIITELDAHARNNPVDAPHFIHAAVAWGDHLLDIGDHREAAKAYGQALETAQRADELPGEAARAMQWAKYQQANALLESNRFSDSLALLDEVAESNAPWATEAAAKADYARIEQRLRGGPVSTEEAG
ncbi:MAG: tetratricopeptide repeat protein [Candidatus Hydrogenedentota bacterium]